MKSARLAYGGVGGLELCPVAGAESDRAKCQAVADKDTLVLEHADFKRTWRFTDQFVQGSCKCPDLVGILDHLVDEHGEPLRLPQVDPSINFHALHGQHYVRFHRSAVGLQFSDRQIDQLGLALGMRSSGHKVIRDRARSFDTRSVKNAEENGLLAFDEAEC